MALAAARKRVAQWGTTNSGIALTLVRRLERQGVPSKQAEAITAATEMLQESNSKFTVEVQRSQDQEHRFTRLHHNIEKLGSKIDNMSLELWYHFNAKLEAAKYDFMTCLIGTIVSVTALGLGVLGLLM